MSFHKNPLCITLGQNLQTQGVPSETCLKVGFGKANSKKVESKQGLKKLRHDLERPNLSPSIHKFGDELIHSGLSAE